MGNIVLRFGVELVTLEPPLAIFQRHNAHVPAAQSGKLATQEPPLVMFQRHKAHVPAAQSLANSPRWNLHLSCSSATMLRFQQPNLWRTGHAGTLTRFSLYKINKC